MAYRRSNGLCGARSPRRLHFRTVATRWSQSSRFIPTSASDGVSFRWDGYQRANNRHPARMPLCPRAPDDGTTVVRPRRVLPSPAPCRDRPTEPPGPTVRTLRGKAIKRARGGVGRIAECRTRDVRRGPERLTSLLDAYVRLVSRLGPQPQPNGSADSDLAASVALKATEPHHDRCGLCRLNRPGFDGGSRVPRVSRGQLA